MVKATLHYYYDPLCGWCYGAAPLLAAAAKVDGLAIALHAGAMMSGPNRQPVTPQLRQYVMGHDARIRQLSGQPFGDGYFNGLLLDSGAVFDSTPPTLAILAAEALGVAGLAMLHRLQQAHYVDGQRIADVTVLQQLAVELGLDGAAFAAEYQRQQGEFASHVGRSHRDMAAHGLRGFPSLLLELDGRLQRVDLSAFLGKPEAFAGYLQGLLAGAAAQVAADGPLCTPDGCQ
ncbi:DsbA family protein [Vogesella oryzae]|uniref:DsbA family protein n=1 Tax=Vogesella oryzae TaxID=1735285 RepID=UPI001583B11D|nr:DsbA family protein [Vogesella oryzae]